MVLTLPGLMAAGLMLGAVGLVVSVNPRQIENFVGMMNFVIFPMVFLSSALYPPGKLREAGAQVIYWLALCNPFSHAVEVIRFAACGKFNGASSAVVVGVGRVAFALAVRGYNPLMGAIGQIRRD